MSVTRRVDISIIGSVDDDYGDRDYDVLVAKLNVICAEYGLELEE